MSSAQDEEMKSETITITLATEPVAVTTKKLSLHDRENIPNTFLEEELLKFTSLADLCGEFMWGYQLMSVLKRLGIHLYKFTERDGKHNGYQFVLGHNVDPRAESFFSRKECSAGKFYVAPSQNFHVWFNYSSKVMQDVWDVVPRDESRVVIESGFKFAMDEFVLANRRSISSLPEWDDPAVVQNAYSAGLKYVTRIRGSALPAIMKFVAVDAGIYEDCLESIEAPDPTMQFMLVYKHPEFVLQLDNPDRMLVCMALIRKPELVPEMKSRGLLDDDLLYLAISQDFSLVAKLENPSEELLRRAFEAMKARKSGSHCANVVLCDILKTGIPLSDEFLLWIMSKLNDQTFSTLVDYNYDTDAVRRSEIVAHPLKAVKKLSPDETNRPLSDELKWLALRSNADCYPFIDSPNQEMSAYAFSRDNRLRLFSPDTPTEEAKAILLASPFLIENMPEPVADELIIATLNSCPSVYLSVPGKRLVVDLVRMCPFVFCQLSSYEKTEEMQMAAVESLIEMKDPAKTLQWMRKSYGNILYHSVMKRLITFFPGAILHYQGLNRELVLYALQQDVTLFPQMMESTNSSAFVYDNVLKYAVTEKPEYLALVPKYCSLDEAFILELVGAHPSAVLSLKSASPLVLSLAAVRDGSLVQPILDKFGTSHKNLISNFLVVSSPKRRRFEEEDKKTN